MKLNQENNIEYQTNSWFFEKIKLTICSKIDNEKEKTINIRTNWGYYYRYCRHQKDNKILQTTLYTYI